MRIWKHRFYLIFIKKLLLASHSVSNGERRMLRLITKSFRSPSIILAVSGPVEYLLIPVSQHQTYAPTNYIVALPANYYTYIFFHLNTRIHDFPLDTVSRDLP